MTERLSLHFISSKKESYSNAGHDLQNWCCSKIQEKLNSKGHLPAPTYYFKNTVDVKPAPLKLPEGTKSIRSYSDVSDSSGPY